MCEITCENFYSELPVIEAALKKSNFVSIDMEFSKIDEPGSKRFSYFDTPEERYNILRGNVSDITCIQLGLSIFTYDINSKTFKSCAYTIYTYPQTFLKSDSVVHFQTACVEFLSKHQFDFNKLFSSSVSYLTDEQEVMIKSEMLNDLFFDEYFINTIRCHTVEQELKIMLNKVSDWYSNASFGDNKLFEVNEHNVPAYIVLLQYRLLKKYKNIIIDEVPLGLSITKTKQTVNLDKLFTNLKQNLLNKMMGVKYLLKLLFKLKKPIIGHNSSLDILILCNQFLHPLPDNFKAFQSFVSTNFGPIYDTKLLFKELKRIIPKSNKWIGNSLPDIYSYLKYGDGNTHTALPNIELSGIREPQDMKLHHAGWDAYYTGYCFIKIINIFKNNSSKSETIYQTFTLTELLKSVESYKNKLFTHRSISSFIDLESGNTNIPKNYLVIQNKGIFYKPLDARKLMFRLNEICTFDIEFISRYTALIITPYRNKCVIIDMKSEFWIEEYSNYQNRKRNQYLLGLGLIIISTPVIIYMYLKK